MPRRGNQEGSIYKRPNGLWAAALQVDGKRVTVYAKTRKEVQDKLQALQRDSRAGKFAPAQAPEVPPNATVQEYLEHWLSTIATSQVRPRTMEHYDLCVRRMIPYIGKLRLAKLTPNDIRAMEAALAEKNGLASRTIHHCHSVLHNALTEAVKQDILVRNPIAAVAPPRIVRKELHTLSRQQVRQLLAVSTGSRYHALWALLITTGLRLGEATALRWRDIDLVRGIATIQRSLQRQRKTGLVFVEPKTAGSRRAVQLPLGAIALLEEHSTIVEKMRADAGEAWQEQDLVFPAAAGGPIEPGRINTALHRDLHMAGLPRLRVHDLRHSAATLLLEEGTHPKVVQDLLGHSTIAMTLDLYSHVTPRLQEEATARMQKLVFDDDVPRDLAPHLKRGSRR